MINPLFDRQVQIFQSFGVGPDSFVILRMGSGTLQAVSALHAAYYLRSGKAELATLDQWHQYYDECGSSVPTDHPVYSELKSDADKLNAMVEAKAKELLKQKEEAKKDGTKKADEKPAKGKK